MLVAIHLWDIDGAKRAGLAAAWINRRRAAYPDPLERPDFAAGDLVESADELHRLKSSQTADGMTHRRPLSSPALETRNGTRKFRMPRTQVAVVA